VSIRVILSSSTPGGHSQTAYTYIITSFIHMKRTQISLDDDTYARLRRRAYEEGRSMSAIVRETLARAFGDPDDLRPRTIRDFAFVGIGRTKPERGAVSERHDDALADAYRGTDR